MKKVLVFLFVAMAALTAKSQVYVGGSLSVWGGDDVTSFGIAPEVGYNFNDQWAVGGVIDFEHSKIGGVKTNAFAIAPYARYTFFENDLLRVFADGGFGISTVGVKGRGDNVNGFEIGIRPGLAIKLTDHLSVLTKVGFFGYRDDYMLNSMSGGGFSLNGEDLSFGLYYTF